MTQKINRSLVICFWLLVIGLLVYTRFINLGWGLPYPMHPDERNMANAIQSLNCKISIRELADCFNPHFFAYGQFPLYLGYLIVWVSKGLRNFGKLAITFDEAVMSIRIISAAASIINVFVIVKIVESLSKVKLKNQKLLVALIAIFSPFFIQFSHFGTTESLLMLFYSLIIYYSIRLSERPTAYEIVRLGLFSGLAVATKVSSILFLAVPIYVLVKKINKRSNLGLKLKFFSFILGFIVCALIFALIFSPHNLINWQEFISSMNYEGDVALGRYVAFYTRQFVNSIPIIFQFKNIFPYVLGLPVFVLSLLGFLLLSWKDKKINILRFSFLIYFLPTASIFAKWSRFMAPIFPLMLIFAILYFLKLKIKIIKVIIIIIAIFPGFMYLSIYQKPDIRFQATDWINKYIPENSLVLSETANVVDIPLINKNNINVISFNFYELDNDPEIKTQFNNYLQKANYIFVPSRRIFANHPKNKYPMLNDYYEKLFSGKLGFVKVAEFSSGLNDEKAEETWTVFDHPMIRIYKKIKSF